MTTLRKNLFKQPFFWTSVCSFLALGILIGLYSYAWVSPTASPNSNAGSAINFSGGNVGIGTVSPSSKLDVVGNIGIRTGNGLRLYNPANTDYATVSLDGVNVVQANYPWNFSGTGDHTISGSVGIGVADPVEKLEVAGNIKMTGTGNGIKFPDGTSQTTAASGGSGTITAIPSGTTGTYSLNWNALTICQFGTCCPPWKDCDGDGKTYQAGNDCDEGCDTCYVGSTASTTSPDGKDQDCNGIVDDSGTPICTPSWGSTSVWGYNSPACQWVSGGTYRYKLGSSCNLAPVDTTHCVADGVNCTDWTGGWTCPSCTTSSFGSAASGSTSCSASCSSYCCDLPVTGTWSKTNGTGCYSTGNYQSYTCKPMTGCTKTVNYY